MALKGYIRRFIRNFIPRIALALVALLAVALLAEMVLRLLPGQQVRKTRTKRTYTSLQCQRDSVVGWIFPPDSQGFFKSGDYPTPVVTNSQGLRNHTIDPSAEVIRLVVLGDSYAFGWGVQAAEAFPQQLASLLAERQPDRAFEVVNGGIPGFAVYQQVRMLERLRSEFPIHAVIATFSLANDPVDELRLARYAPDRLAEYSYLVRRPNSFLSRLIKTSRLLTLIDRRTQNLQFHWANASGHALDLAEASLRNLFLTCQQDSLPVLLVVVPRASEVLPSSFGKRLFNFSAKRPRQLALRMSREYSVPMVDLKEILHESQLEQTVYLKGDAHWTAAGHRITAEHILEGTPVQWWESVYAGSRTPPKDTASD